MDDLPIDIHSTKLLDWIISRRYCKKNWQDSIPQIREKMALAIIDMPENEQIVALLQASYINYFHCKEIVDILKETEKDTMNMFGYYSSQRMKDWQEIIVLYEKDSVYLAESAQFLQRFVQYEIPGLRKQIIKAENGIKDNEKKEEEYMKQSINSQKNFEKELEKFGIPDGNLHQSLLKLTNGVPALLRDVNRQISELRSAVEYFDVFREYTASELLTAKTYGKSFPLLRLLFNRFPDDVTYYEWRYGKVPEKIESFQLENVSTQDQDTKDDEIDFGDDDIDFGNDIEITTATGEIDIEILDEAGCNDISSSTNVARGNEALFILQHPDTLPSFISELVELHSFLTFRRVDELTESGSDIYLAGIDNRPQAISAVKFATIEQWISQIETIKSVLEDPRNMQLFKILSSPIYVEELVSQLEKKRQQEQKYKRMAELAAERQKEFSEQVVRSNELLNAVIESTKTLQENLESDISRRYNNRDVYIMGEINAVLYGSQ